MGYGWNIIFGTISFLAALLILVLFKTRKNRRILKMLSEFNGPLSIPIIGTAYILFTMGGIDGMFNYICYKFISDYGRLLRLWYFNDPQVLIASAKDAEKVLNSARHIKKSKTYNLFHPWLGQGLLTVKETTWKTHRKILMPAFHFSILHKFLHIFNKNGKILADKLSTISAGGKEFKVFDPLTMCALDIINESSMGATMNAQFQENTTYVNAVKSMSVYSAIRFFSLYLRDPFFYQFSSLKRKVDKALKIINGFTEIVIVQRRKYLQSLKNGENQSSEDMIEDDIGAKKKNVAFIDVLLKAQEDERQIYNDADIRDEVNTFLVAGQDTVTTAMGWTLFLIGTYPEVQEKVLEELIAVFGDSGREPTMSDLSELKYLERCIKETLRMYPSIPFFERELQEDITLDCGRVIPTGCDVMFLAYAIHRDPEHFPDPETFDPDRFLPENTIGRHPYAYLPFSAGPRNCIGQKYALLVAKSLLSTILRRFRVEAAQSLNGIILLTGLGLRPRKGLKVRLFEREAQPNLRVISAEEQASPLS